MKLIKSLFAFLFLLALGYSSGYVHRDRCGPPVSDVLARLGWTEELPWAGQAVSARDSDRTLAATPEQEAFQVRQSLRAYMSQVSKRIGELEARRKEKRTALNIYASSGEPKSSVTVQRLMTEEEGLTETIQQLGDQLAEAREGEATLQSIVDAAVAANAGYVEDDQSLLDARRVLARMELLFD